MYVLVSAQSMILDVWSDVSCRRQRWTGVGTAPSSNEEVLARLAGRRRLLLIAVSD